MNPLSNRACGFPAQGLTMIFRTWHAQPANADRYPGARRTVTRVARSPAYPPERHAARHTSIAGVGEFSCFNEGLLGLAAMPSHLPPGQLDQSRVPSLQRVMLHAFPGTMDPSDSLPAPHDFSHPALYARSLPDVGCQVGPLLFRLSLCKRAAARTPERSSTGSGLLCCLWPSP
jgi:hypothetical protein